MAKRLPNMGAKSKTPTTHNKSKQDKPKTPSISQKRTKLSQGTPTKSSKSIKLFSPRTKTEKEKTEKLKKLKPKRHKRTEENKRQYRRVMAFIRRAKKRGYRFDSDFVESIPLMTTRELKALTPEVMYQEAYYYYEGEIISGTEARAIERSISAQLGAETRRKNREREEKERRKWDGWTGRDYIPLYTDIILTNVADMIQEAKNNPVVVGYGPRTTEQNAIMLEGALDREIENYGRYKVAEACENAPDQVIVGARETIMASSQEACTQCVMDLIMIITGAIPTIEEAKQYQETETAT